MDFTYFIQNKELIPPALKAGLYCVMQSHLPKSMQAFRCGLAGKPVDSATQFKSAEGNFASRFATYLNYWMPTDAKVFAILTVPRRAQMGFAERILPERVEGDNREDYQLLHLAKTLIEVREKQYHSLLMSGEDRMTRLGMPGTDEERKRGEFFRGPLEKVIRSLRSIGTGDLYLFESNDISKIKKIELRKRGIETIKPEQIELRKSPRLYGASPLLAQLLEEGDTLATKAVEKLRDVVVVEPPTVEEVVVPKRRSPRLAGEEVTIGMSAAQLEALKKGDPKMTKAVQAIQQIRRSPRLRDK